MDKQTCPHCGQTISPRKENLSRGILKTLVKFRARIHETGVNKVQPMNDLSLTKSEYNNFQKLRYHALVAKYKENGVNISGYWLLTKRGEEFLNGSQAVPKSVYVLKNRVISHSPIMVRVGDVIKDTTIPYFPKKEDIQYVPGGLF